MILSHSCINTTERSCIHAKTVKPKLAPTELWLSLFQFYDSIKSFTDCSLPRFITYFDLAPLCPRYLRKCPYCLRTRCPGRDSAPLTRRILKCIRALRFWWALQDVPAVAPSWPALVRVRTRRFEARSRAMSGGIGCPWKVRAELVCTGGRPPIGCWKHEDWTGSKTNWKREVWAGNCRMEIRDARHVPVA